MVKTTNRQKISGGGQLLGRLGKLPNNWQEYFAAINGRRILARECLSIAYERIVHISAAFERAGSATRKAVAA